MPTLPSSGAPRRLALVIAALVACAAIGASPLAAQESVFGQLGFGVPDDGLSIRSRGMGNASGPLPGIQFTFRNPSALATFDRSGISVAGLFQSRKPEDASGDSRQNSGDVPFIQLVFPLGHGLALGGGYYRYLDFDGFIDTSALFQGDTLPVRLTSDGGVSVLSPQLAKRFSHFLRIGGGVDFYTGSREQLREIDFDTLQAVSTTDSIARRLGGVGFSVGTQIAPTRNLVLAGSYRSRVTLDGDLDAAPGFNPDSASNPVPGGTPTKLAIRLPASAYAGLSYRVRPELIFAGEVEIARWSDFRVNGARDPTFHDELGFGAGLEYSFHHRVGFLPVGTVVRAGARSRDLPQRLNGEPVRERAVSVGFGQLVGIGATNVDLALEVGKRGSLQRNGIQEPFVRLGVALSAFEQWASRTPGPRPLPPEPEPGY